MQKMNHEEGRYRVLLIGIGDNTEDKRESFCKNISEIYGISLPLLRKIVDRCPTVLKKKLSLKKAEALAKTLESFGAVVSVEEKRDSSAVSLEFQGGPTHQIALEASYLRRTESGAWHVIGRARNISETSLNDIWVLIQLFDDVEEFLTFEEAPLPINPLPPGEASPFKVVFEGELPIRKGTLAFKNSVGCPLPAVDKREKREWVQIKMDTSDEDDYFPTASFLPGEVKTETPSIDPAESSQGISPPSEMKFSPLPVEESQEKREEPKEEVPGDDLVLIQEDLPSHRISEEPLDKGLELAFEILEKNKTQARKERETWSEHEPPQVVAIPALEKVEGQEGEAVRPDLGSPPTHRESIFPETRVELSLFEEATKLLEEISRGPAERLKEEPSPFPWIEDFRNSVEAYDRKGHDIFSSWFQANQKEEKFANPLHSVLTILVHARFNQGNQSAEALENTERVFKLILQPNPPLEDIPSLEGTPFFSGESWRELFHRAIPKLQKVANNILEKTKWNAYDLERLIQIIPHMSGKNSWMAIRWIHELIPNVIEMDLSDASVAIGESLYRVGSRLGVVDPFFDFYEGKNSTGDLKVQKFARAAYPQNPARIEKLMTWVGTMKEDGGGGYCLPNQPHCTGCPFEAFCPRLQWDFDPSAKGMKRG